MGWMSYLVVCKCIVPGRMKSLLLRGKMWTKPSNQSVFLTFSFAALHDEHWISLLCWLVMEFHKCHRSQCV